MCQFDRKVQYFVNWTPYFSEKNPDLKNEYRRTFALSYKIHGVSRSVTKTARSPLHSLQLRMTDYMIKTFTVYESNIKQKFAIQHFYTFIIFSSFKISFV